MENAEKQKPWLRLRDRETKDMAVTILAVLMEAGYKLPSGSLQDTHAQALQLIFHVPFLVAGDPVRKLWAQLYLQLIGEENRFLYLRSIYYE